MVSEEGIKCCISEGLLREGYGSSFVNGIGSAEGLGRPLALSWRDRNRDGRELENRNVIRTGVR